MRHAVLVAIVLLVSPLTAQAGEGHEASGRTISYRTAVEVLERNAENKPIKGTAERIGVTLHETGPGAGTFSQISILSTWERTAKGGVYSGTLHRTFADGEKQDIAFNGRFGKGRAEGTYECAGGTGKYARATCGGTYKSESFPNGMAANRWSGNIEFAE
jgi:hypothetical protein